MDARGHSDSNLLVLVLSEATVNMAEFEWHHMALLLKLIINFTFFIIIGRRCSSDSGASSLHSSLDNEQLIGALSFVQRVHARQAVSRILATLFQLVNTDVLVEFQDLFFIFKVQGAYLRQFVD